MTALNAPYLPFARDELAPAQRRLRGCVDCHAEVPLSPRTGRCATCMEREAYDIATRQDVRRYRPRPSLWRVVPWSGVAWLTGALVFCGALFAFVPTVGAH